MVACGNKKKEAKAAAREKAASDYKELNAYITISFADAEEKRLFCELAEVGEDATFIKGCQVLELIQ